MTFKLFSRELSRGHFSADNQKELNGPSDIPIYEAKITRDLRLVVRLLADLEDGPLIYPIATV